MNRDKCGTARSGPDPGAPVVFVVDSDALVRESLDSLVRCEGWQPRMCACATEFLSHPHVTAPSCLMLDVTAPGANGTDLQRILAARAELRIIAIAAYADIPTIVRVLKAGAADFLSKPLSDEQVLTAIRIALAQSRASLTQETKRRELQTRYSLLSTREREVMHLIIEGRLNKQIAGELRITEFTVKAHRGRMMRKLGATSFADLFRRAEMLCLTSMATVAEVRGAADFSAHLLAGFPGNSNDRRHTL